MKTLSTLLLSTILAESSTSAALAQEHEPPASMVAVQLGDAIAAGDIDTLRLLLAPDVLIFESGMVLQIPATPGMEITRDTRIRGRSRQGCPMTTTTSMPKCRPEKLLLRHASN